MSRNRPIQNQITKKTNKQTKNKQNVLSKTMNPIRGPRIFKHKMQTQRNKQNQ